MEKIPGRLIPQIRELDLVKRAISALAAGARTAQDISDRTGIRERQVAYALNAAETLEWMTESQSITHLGQDVIAASDSDLPILIRKSIRHSRILSIVAPTLLDIRPPTQRELLASIQRFTDLGTGTAERRAADLLTWRKKLVDLNALNGTVQLSLIGSQTDENNRRASTPTADNASKKEGYGPHFQDLRDTLRKSARNTVVITGAGIGALSGLPLWDRLRTLLCDELTREAEAMPDENMRHSRLSLLASIMAMSDLWSAFARIKREMSPPSFTRMVRNFLTPAADQEPNPFYNRIWSLGVRGIVTFNMDETAENSYANIFGATTVSCDTKQPQQYSSLLHADAEHFVFHPHGRISAPGSWVFTTEDRDEVINTPAYKKFVTSLLLTKTVIIAGFNPSDLSFESHVIDIIRQTGGDAHRVYIICAKEFLGSDVYEKYRSWDFRIITYSLRKTSQNQHEELLELIDQIVEYVPDSDVPVSAFRGDPLPPDELPPDDVLYQLDEELVRERLNAAVAYISNQCNATEKSQLSHITSLFKNYPRSTYKAWFFVPGDPHLGRLFGHLVESEIGGGAFGRVYVTQKNQELFAAKVLLAEVRKDPIYLLSFRRGIKSMKILNEHHVEGMVRMMESYEVPPTIFMEHINGLTLDVAVKDGYVKSMRSKLVVLERIAHIVATAHELDEVVLHRDLKPANVMLRDPVFGSDDFDVVVLDFDLSWHKGSHELSVAHNARMQGYAAPEQVQQGDTVPSALTRNTGVDSFGFGMLIFYVFAERHPIPGEQKLPSFRRMIFDEANRRNTYRWRCVSRQLSNLAHACINDRQTVRPSLREAQILLRGLISAIDDGVLSADDMNVRYEIVDRVFEQDDYSEHAKDEDGELSVDIPPIFMSVTLVPMLDGQAKLVIRIRRLQMEHDHRGSFHSKYAESRVPRAMAELKSVGFEVNNEGSSKSIEIVASCIRTEWSSKDVGKIADAIRGCRHNLTGA